MVYVEACATSRPPPGRSSPCDRTWTRLKCWAEPGPKFFGEVTLEAGQYRWNSGTTGRTGISTLHEGDGRCVLVSRAADGSSYAESTSAK